MTAKLITDKSNIAYLSNFTGSAGFMLIAGRTKYLFTDFRYIERAENSIKKGIKIVDISKLWRSPAELKTSWSKLLNKHKVKTLGVEESNLTVARYKHFKKISPKIKLTDISGEIEAEREVKSKEEIRIITKSQRINEKVFKDIHNILKKRPRVTEIEIAKKIKALGNKYGAEDVSFDPIVGFGKNTSIVHHEPGNTILKKNDLILIDMGMKYKGYCSDMTRMIPPAKPSQKLLEIYTLVYRAQMNAIKNIKAGMTGAAADALSRKMIQDAGYGEQYGHSGGHGVGLDIHETPNLSSKYTKKLKANSVITVEPGIYLPGEFGVRIEDMLLVTKSGNKNLTQLPK